MPLTMNKSLFTLGEGESQRAGAQNRAKCRTKTEFWRLMSRRWAGGLDAKKSGESDRSGESGGSGQWFSHQPDPPHQPYQPY